MAFLTINGVDVPVANGSVSIEEIEIGERSRAYDGTMRSTVRAFKREWKIKTPPQTPAQADMLAGLVRGQGDVWAFDSQDLYSAKGFLFSTTTPAPTYTAGGHLAASAYYASFPAPYGQKLPAMLGVKYTGTSSPYSLCWFQKGQDAATWHNWIINAVVNGSGGLTTTTYKDGATYSGSNGNEGPAFYLTSDNCFTIGQPVQNAGYQGSWLATHAYTLGQTVTPAAANGFLYMVTVAGTTSGSAPTWPTTLNATVTDGTVTWKCVGPASCVVDEVYQAPVPLNAAAIASLSSATANWPVLPQLTLTGDLVQGVSTTAIGKLETSSFVQFADSAGTWYDNGRILEFLLQEF